jgi:hypothetical protein
MSQQPGQPAHGGPSLSLAVALGLAIPLALAYKTGPPAGHTGGFGEPTCGACHADDVRNPRGGSLDVRGFPERFVPGKDYTIAVRVRGPGMGRGGYQLAVRIADGDRAGVNAGTLEATDARSAVTTVDRTGVQYAQHLIAGVDPLWTDSTEWTLRWTAPAAGAGTVVLHVAANAANYDDSEYGDRIYDTALKASEARRP